MKPGSAGRRLVRWCLRLLPPEARGEYAAEIEDLVRRRSERLEGARPPEVALFWIREVASALGAVVAAHADRLRRGWTGAWAFELRSAGRALKRQPLFAGSTVLVLGLGVGATAGVGGVGWAVLAAPLPYPDADRLVRLFHDDDLTFGVSLTEVIHYRKESRTLDDVAGWVLGDATLTGPDGGRPPERVATARVTTNLLTLLGRRPAVGRAFSDPGGAAELVLSHRFWHRRFGGSVDVVGRTVSIGDEPHTIVGVLPAEVTLPDPSVDVWLPVPLDVADVNERGRLFLDVVARLAPGRRLPAAAAEVDVLARALRSADPEAYEAEEDFGGHVAPLRDVQVRAERPLLVALTTGAGGLLLATGFTVALLVRGRALRRADEMAVRRALGAGRGALTRLRVAELGVLALSGAGVGALVAAAVARGIAALVPDALAFSGRGPLAAALPVVPAAGLLAALLLALLILPGGVSGQLPPGSSRTTTLRPGPLRHLLPGAQVAMALVLLGGSILLQRTVARLVSTDLGYRVEDVLSARISLSDARHPGPAERQAFFAEVLRRLRADPTVEAVGLVSALPLSGYGGSGDVYVEAVSPDSALDVAVQRVAGGDYFGAAGIPLLAGRSFGPGDRLGGPRVAVVDEVLARRYFGEPRRAVGGRIRFFLGGESWNEVVGVVGHVRHSGPTSQPEGQIYVPFAQRPDPSAHVLIHHGGPPAALARSLRRMVAEVDPSAAVHDVATMTDRLRARLRVERAARAVFASFGTLALLLAVAGTWGVVTLAQEQTVQEMAIRRALGAPAHLIAGRVAADGLIGLGGGIAVGVGGAVAMGLLLERLLSTVQGGHGWAVAGAAALVLVSGALATAGPVRRGLAVGPARALRGE